MGKKMLPTVTEEGHNRSRRYKDFCFRGVLLGYFCCRNIERTSKILTRWQCLE